MKLFIEQARPRSSAFFVVVSCHVRLFAPVDNAVCALILRALWKMPWHFFLGLKIWKSHIPT